MTRPGIMHNDTCSARLPEQSPTAQRNLVVYGFPDCRSATSFCLLTSLCTDLFARYPQIFVTVHPRNPSPIPDGTVIPVPKPRVANVAAMVTVVIIKRSTLLIHLTNSACKNIAGRGFCGNVLFISTA